MKGTKMKTRYIIFAILLMAAPVMAGDGSESDSSTWVTMLLDVGLKALWATVAAVILWSFKKMFSEKVESQVYNEALEALREGIDTAQEDYVTWWKRASKDGKLSKEEREDAVRMAWNHAKAITRGPVFDLVKSWSFEKARSLVRQIMGKGGANVVIKNTAIETGGENSTKDTDGINEDVTPEDGGQEA